MEHVFLKFIKWLTRRSSSIIIIIARFINTKLSRNFYFLKFPSRIEKRIKDVFSFPEQILLLNTIRNCVYMQTNRFLMQKYLHTEFWNSCLHVLLAHLDIQYLHISKKEKKQLRHNSSDKLEKGIQYRNLWTTNR